MSLVDEILEKLEGEKEIVFNFEVSGGLVSEAFRTSFPVGQGLILLSILVSMRGFKKPKPIEEVVGPVSYIIKQLYPNLIEDQFLLMNSLIFRKNIVDGFILAEIIGLLEGNPEVKGEFLISKKGRDFLRLKLKEPSEAGLLLRKLDEKAKYSKYKTQDVT